MGVGVGGVPYAGTDADRHVADFREVGCGDGRAYFFCRRHAALAPWGVWQQYCEFFAAIAGYKIDRTGVFIQQVRQLLQDGVPRRVAVRVVDLLEMVGVEQQHGKRR